MRYPIVLFVLLCVGLNLCAQQKVSTYTITADSVLLTNCDSSELIIQNHTQNIPGFLFNTGNGRTIFKRAAQALGNGGYVFGGDTVQVGSPNAWLQGGNRFGTTGVLGTLDSNHLDLYTNGSARARLTKTGNFLIGSTTDNGYRLQTTGGIFQDGGVYHKNYYTDVRQASFEMGSGYELYGIPHASGGYIYYLSGGLNGDFDSGWEMAIGNSNNKIMEINENVISTNQVLQVNAGINFSEQNSYVQSPYVGFQYQTQSGWNWALMNTSNQPNFMVTYLGNTVLGSTVDYNLKLQVNGSGYVSDTLGIGTPYPTAQLHTTGSVRFAGLTQDSTQTQVLVSDANGNLYYRSAASLVTGDPVRSSLAVNGTIKSKKIIISPDEWADYVFDSSYRLPQLAEVESYISREHHLPGIPSAAAVQKDSLDVGAGQAALLKKIEELTLYTIEQKKEMDAMKARMERLEKLLEENTK